MSQPSPTKAANDRALARAREEITRRTAEGEFGHPPNIDLRDRAMMEIFEQELSNRPMLQPLDGTWTLDMCSCGVAPLNLRRQGEDALLTSTHGWCGLNFRCLGAQPETIFKRVPGTNTFRADGSEARTVDVLDQNGCEMLLDGNVYRWGPFSEGATG